jgi:hypothetical protein
MAKQLKPRSNELWPKILGHGPKLRLEDGRLYMSLGSSNTFDAPIGTGPDDAAAIVTYTSLITADSADALTMEGLHVIGYLLLDGEGRVFARLASDDEIVYDRAQVESFATRAGLAFADWGEVPDKRIDTMMKTPRTKAPKKTLGATRREWLMFVSIAGGFLAAWPFASHIPHDTSRTESYAIFALGISGFLVGALGLAIGRYVARFTDKAVLVVGLVVAAILLVASASVGHLGWHVWELTPPQTGACLLGLAVVAAVQPFWARANRAR